MEIGRDMEARSIWYDKITKEINSYKDTLSKKEQKKYKLDLLPRVAERVEDFSSYCGECQAFQQEITTLVQDLGNLMQMPGREAVKRYSEAVSNMVKHLQKQHKLVSEGHYVGIGLAIGAGVGTVFGSALEGAGIGTAIGTAIGFTIGSYLKKKAEEEGKLI